MTIAYFAIAFFASLTGAISGIGGGVIIKPVLDFMAQYDVATIGFLSSATVLTMTATRLLRSRGSQVNLHGPTAALMAGGSVVGGLSGKLLFDLIRTSFHNDALLGSVQSALLACLALGVLAAALFKERLQGRNIRGIAASLLCGIVLGAIASFLGIGGGPINLAALALLFSMDSKTAALHSIFIIFFSQLSNIVFTLAVGNMPAVSPAVLIFMLAGGVLGGLIGEPISRKLAHRHLDYLFMISTAFIIILSIRNFASYLKFLR